ncbi:MAG: polyketide synthase dehydratase domain-containing protein, partial [Verrucomicrobia bacterium]|nr:polyketide synthase dehydratase domain-containing protein [Verrucomicrobiota bacterium]
MGPAADQLETVLADLAPQPGNVPFFSNVTGARQPGEACDAAHWGRGIRQPVQFAPAVGALAEFGVDIWLEIGAHPALVHSIQESLGGRGSGAKAPVFASVRRERELESALETALDLHRAGVMLDFAAMTPSRQLLPLPAYAWERARWWHESRDWRESRLAPGGRGLLEARLPRATPTWVTCLDARHMAFLKDHKVDSHVIFPAAAFVEMALEAGAQLFEGRPFAVEDFEIRKPLLLPDPASSVQLELSYSPTERTFVIQSRMENSSAWSLHVVGSLRGERTDSAFAASRWEGGHPAGTQTVEVEGFYQHMSDLGLRYGEEFKSVRELAAGAGRSAGRVALSEAVAPRAGEYALHPVLLDGALHVFSAGAATVEDRHARMKLPVRFARILFLRPPGAAAQVRADVRDFNDDFLEGDLALYDEAGAPCVLVDGFRAISVAGVRRAGGASGGLDGLTYHVAWERTPTADLPAVTAPVPLGQLRASAQHALDEVIATRGRDVLESAMAADDDLAAAHIAQGLREMGVTPGSVFTADSLGIAEPMRLVFERMLAKLTKRRWFTQTKKGFRPTVAFTKAADSAPKALRTNLAEFPGHFPEALLCAGNAAELGPILRGEKDAVQVLFTGAGAEMLEHFYSDGLITSHWLAAIAAAVTEAARALPEGRGLRILEIGAGTGGLTAHLLPLLERGLHAYTFTDVSAGFFSAAAQKLATFPEVEFKVFDLERPGTEQEFQADSYDFIIGTNVLHAVADVRATTRHLHALLAPGGSFMFIDTATPQLWTETVFGLTPGWWRFTDRDLRPEQPLLGRPQWESVLRDVGFAETAALPGINGPEGEGQFAVLARKPWRDADFASEESAAEAPPVESSWLVFADESGVGNALAARLRRAGARCRVARRGGRYAAGENDTFTLRADVPADWRKLLAACAETPPERIAYLWPLDAPADPGADSAMGTDALLHLAQALGRELPTAKLRFDLITRGAQPVGRDALPTAVAQAPALGMFRVILNEHPSFTCRAIDLSPKPSAADERTLWHELLREDATEREVAFRGEARYAQRLDRGIATREQSLDPAVPLRLESRDRGHLDAVRFAPFTVPACEPGQVLIDVQAAGMNFRDVLKALALYPGEAPDARIFGDEVGGIVRAVGEGVTHVAPGDRVFGLAVFGLATQTLARGGDVRRIPAGLSFEEAATLPVVFMTAWHALQNVARVRPGERVLIHAGAGGVGMAAVQIAQHFGAEV